MEHLRSVVQRLIDSDQNDDVYMTFGCDFAFTNAEIDYHFLDKVIKRWNQEFPNVQMMYSTPVKYINQIKKTAHAKKP